MKRNRILPIVAGLLFVEFLAGVVWGIHRGCSSFFTTDILLITSFTKIGLVVSIFGLTKAVTNLGMGVLSDRIGRKPVIIIGSIISALGGVVIASANNFNYMLLGTALIGLGGGSTFVGIMVSMTEAIPSQTGLAMGLFQLAAYGGSTFGTSLAGYLAVAYGLRQPFYALMVISAVGAIMGLLMIPETKRFVEGELPPIEIGGFLLHRPDSIPMPPRDGAPRSGRRVTEVLISIQACIRAVPALLFRSLFKMFKRVTQFIHPFQWVVSLSSFAKRLGPIYFAGFSSKIMDSLVISFLPLFLTELGMNLERTVTIMSAFTLSWALLQPLTGHISDRLGRKRIIVVGLAGSVVSVLSFTITSDFNLLLISALILGVEAALFYTPLVAMVSDIAPPELEGTLIGSYRFFRDLGYFVGPIFLGAIADRYGLTSIFYATSLCLFLAMILFHSASREPTREM